MSNEGPGRVGALGPIRAIALAAATSVLLVPAAAAEGTPQRRASGCPTPPAPCVAGGIAPEIEWAAQFGTTRYDLAYAVTAVGDDVYVAGFTNFALPGQHYHHRYDAFVRKVDAEGRTSWTRQFGSNGVDQILGIDADDRGVVVVGSTDGRLPRQRAAGGLDVFVARFGPGGRELWVRQLGTSGDDVAAGAAIGPGGVYVVGSTTGAWGEPRGGASDAFVSLVGAEGDVRWVRQFGTDGADEAAAVDVRGARVVVVGSATGTWRRRYLGGPSDGFAAAFGTTGAPRWRRPVGTTGADRLTGVVARADGLFVTGTTDGTLPGQASLGALDAFAGGFGADGSRRWLHQFGSALDDEAVAVAGGAGEITVAGSTTGALSGEAAIGEWDAFVRGFGADGTPSWTRQLGTDDYDRVYGVAVGTSGMYLVGTTHGAFEGEVNAGDRDVFVVRLAFA
jgi:hypothetical protein